MHLYDLLRDWNERLLDTFSEIVPMLKIMISGASVFDRTGNHYEDSIIIMIIAIEIMILRPYSRESLG